MTQRHELLAWLGDDHGLNHHELDELITIADELSEQYPGPDGQAERDNALTTAYRLMLGPAASTISELADDLTQARTSESAALAGLRQAARQLIAADEWSEAGFAREARVDRMTVRKWLGKRD